MPDLTGNSLKVLTPAIVCAVVFKTQVDKLVSGIAITSAFSPSILVRVISLPVIDAPLKHSLISSFPIYNLSAECLFNIVLLLISTTLGFTLLVGKLTLKVLLLVKLLFVFN